MSPRRMFRSRTGWMSAAAVLVVAGVLAGTMLANAAGPPLPKRTPAQLLVAMHDARPPAAFSGVITENANLGFPSLPNIPGLQSSILSGASFITGTHTVEVWYDGPRHVRIALPVSFGETDLRVNGNQVWLWDSHGQTATHYILPAAPSRAQIKQMRVARLRLFKQIHPRLMLPRCIAAVRQRLTEHPGDPAGARRAIAKCLKGMKIGRQVHAIAVRPLTPQQAANKFLAAIGPTTKVTVAGSMVVAGRSAYQLVIAPRTSQSLIGQIVIAVDSKTYLPLQLQVFARGTSSPAFQIGFTSLTFGTPAASNFTFTPPAGAHVKTEKLPAVMPGLLGPLSMGGLPAPLPGPFTSQRFLPHGPFRGSKDVTRAVWNVPPPAAIGSVKGRVYIRAIKGVRRVWSVGKGWAPTRAAVHFAPNSYAGYASQSQVIVSASPTDVAPAAVPEVKVLGSGWLSVAVIPAGDALAGFSPSPAKRPHPLVLPPGSAPAGQISGLLRILLNSAAPVHGTWGSGRLLRTNLFSVLVTSNGKVLIGAVTPAVLYADAAKVK